MSFIKSGFIFNCVYSLLIIFTFSTVAKARTFGPIADGTIDLTDWDPALDQPIELNGEWEFFWDQKLDPQDFELQNEIPGKSYKKVPGLWNPLGSIGTGHPNKGIATYRLFIKMNDTPKKLGLHIREIRSSYRVYVDQDLLFTQGKVGKTLESSLPDWPSRTLEFENTGGDLEIIIQVANFCCNTGGFPVPILLGNAKSLTKFREKEIIIKYFIVGGLLLMGMMLLVFFMMRPQDKGYLMLGSIAVVMSVRTVLSVERNFYEFNYLITFENIARAYLISGYLMLPLFTALWNFMFPKEFIKKINQIFYFISAIIVAIVLVAPLRVFFHTALIFQITCIFSFLYFCFCLVRALMRKRKGSVIMVLGSISLVLMSVNDMLYLNGMLNTRLLLPIGFILFLLLQFFLLAGRTTLAFSLVEKLTQDLTIAKNNLEQRVASRTKELAETNRLLMQKIEAHKQMEAMLRDTTKKAEIANEAKTRFLANMSHELRTPMHGILAFSKLGISRVSKISKDKLLYYLSEIQQSGARLLRLLDELLDLSKLESGALNYKFVRTSIFELVKLVINEQQALIDEKKLTVSFEKPIFENASVLDPERIMQVIRNLLSNACKFSPEGSEIKFKLQLQNKIIVFSIEDQGIGIPESELERVFERFFQSGISENRVGGTGLGLAVCKHIIEDHQGKIWADNNSDGGAIFQFEIPVSPSPIPGKKSFDSVLTSN